MFALNGRENALPCFQIGIAVHKAYRRKGLAKRMLASSICEIHDGFRGAGHPAFYIEAVVGHDNKASQRLCEGVSGSPRGNKRFGFG
jgi:ribosomal protein S18 acetylase RimI-like enzyme